MCVQRGVVPSYSTVTSLFWVNGTITTQHPQRHYLLRALPHHEVLCDGIPCSVMLFLDQSDRKPVLSPVPIGNHCFAAVYAPPSASEEHSGHKLFSILNFALSPGPNGALFQFSQPFPSLSFVILSDKLINFYFVCLYRGSSLGNHYRANLQCPCA